MTLFTIGYGGVTPAALIDTLREAGVRLVLDVRIWPQSKSQPAYCQDALRALLEQAGLRYHHAPELGNVALEQCRAAKSLDPYRTYLDQHPEVLDGLLALLLQHGRVAILCGCPRQDQCHRGVIAKAVWHAAQGAGPAWLEGLEVRHLKPPQGEERGPAPRILGLTLQQPWAWAICHAGKRVENRTWRPWCPPGTRLAIRTCVTIHSAPSLSQPLPAWQGLALPTKKTAPQGIVAVARLVEVVTQGHGDPWFFGPLGWTLDDVVTLPEPVPCKGLQGLWRLPDEVLMQVRQGYAAARKP